MDCVALVSGDSTQHLTEAGKNKSRVHTYQALSKALSYYCMHGKIATWIWFHPA